MWGQACSKPTGLLQISSDRDDQNISEGLKFSILGFFGVGKFAKYLFGWLDFIRGFGVLKTVVPVEHPWPLHLKEKCYLIF